MISTVIDCEFGVSMLIVCFIVPMNEALILDYSQIRDTRTVRKMIENVNNPCIPDFTVISIRRISIWIYGTKKRNQIERNQQSIIVEPK